MNNLSSSPPISCSQCGKTKTDFSSSSNFQRHLKIHEKRNEVSQCTLCGKQFQLKSAMSAHLKNVHNEPDQECYDCGKIFSTKANLKRHISVHNEEQRKSFNCEYCGKGYKRQSDLRVHVQKQHLPIVSETDESYEFKCDKCTKSFQDENTLIEHACFPKDNSFLNEYLVSKSTNNNKNALQNQSFTYFFTKK